MREGAHACAREQGRERERERERARDAGVGAPAQRAGGRQCGALSIVCAIMYVAHMYVWVASAMRRTRNADAEPGVSTLSVCVCVCVCVRARARVCVHASNSLREREGVIFIDSARRDCRDSLAEFLGSHERFAPLEALDRICHRETL